MPFVHFGKVEPYLPSASPILDLLLRAMTSDVRSLHHGDLVIWLGSPSYPEFFPKGFGSIGLWTSSPIARIQSDDIESQGLSSLLSVMITRLLGKFFY